MKKLSTLIAILLIATIGGVYATWTYSQGAAVMPETVFFDSVTEITGAVQTNAKGVVEIVSNDIEIVIDDSNNNHKAEWNMTGEIVVKFTPNVGADEDVVLDGIDLKWNLLTTNKEGVVAWAYDNKKIFYVDTTAVVLSKTDANEESGSFVWTITANDLMEKLTFNSNEASDINPAGADTDLYLPTVEDYSNYHTSLHSGAMGIVFAEYTGA